MHISVNFFKDSYLVCPITLYNVAKRGTQLVGFVDDIQGRQISYYTKAQYQAKEKKIHKGPRAYDSLWISSVKCAGEMKDCHTGEIQPYKTKLISLPSVMLFNFKESEAKKMGILAM